MATLNLSSNGPSITKSYQAVVDGALPSGGAAASSPTYGQWAVYSVAAPLVNAFQQDAGKESVLKVQSTGEGELVDLIDEFSDGRIQFGFVKVKDPNTGLPKSVLIAWCGEGVPERTKGYFGSHLSAVTKLLHGYHVQVTARSDSDLTPEGIVRKVADASGSKYSGDSAPTSSTKPPPPMASKPVFTPTQVDGGSRGFNPLASRSRQTQQGNQDTDNDGWGTDAPAPTRTQLEKVESAYRPTKVDMGQLASQRQEPSRFSTSQTDPSGNRADIVSGGYQPIGKVDIAALRRQAQDSGSAKDDRPAPVKGSYEPVGKVDIAAIRARAQPTSDSAAPAPVATPARMEEDSASTEPKSLAQRSAAFTPSERITALPKAKVANKFGSGQSNFTGTKAPAPSGIGGTSIPSAAPVGTASKNFADQGGKTPAQLWAERKARERGDSNPGSSPMPAPASPVASQASGGDWQSGYAGKKWNAVQTTKTGQSSSADVVPEQTEDETRDKEPVENVAAIRDRFKNAVPMGGAANIDDDDAAAASPPPTDMSSKPNASRGVPMPGLPRRAPQGDEEDEPVRMPTPPAQPPRSPTPPTPPAMSGSPIRVAMPVGRGAAEELEPAEAQLPRAAIPVQSISNAIPHRDDIEDEPQVAHEDLARGAGAAVAAASFGAAAADAAAPGAHGGGKSALVQFDYEKAEDNELELREGEYVTNIEMVDDDWWLGENPRGEKGLFPSNYVELVEGDGDVHQDAPDDAPAVDETPAAAEESSANGATATAQYDYEAAEDNELSFPDGATITGVEFPDEDWWLGEYNGKKGLFPANYVQLDE